TSSVKRQAPAKGGAGGTGRLRTLFPEGARSLCSCKRARRIFRETHLRRNTRAGARAGRGARGAAPFRDPAALGAAPALRPPPRMRWRLEVVGGAERALPRSGRETPRSADRRPPLRL